MAENKNDRITPKRGAFPTPKDVLDKAIPYIPDDSKPDKPGAAVDEGNPEPDSAATSRRLSDRLQKKRFTP